MEAIILIVALATYMTRLLPFLLKEKLNFERWSEILSSSSTAIISSLFVTSLLTTQTNLNDFSIGVVSLAVVTLTFLKWRNMGLSVVFGVLAYLFISLAFKFIL